MKEMGHLTPRLLEMPSVRMVNGWYGTSLTELHSFKTLQPSEEVIRKFTEVLQNIRRRHTTVVETLAQGYMEFSDLGQVKQYEEKQIQYFLDRFYLSRISIRLLIYQHSNK
jgi:pyruvate dehydrogenase kinase 2/3/4